LYTEPKFSATVRFIWTSDNFTMRCTIVQSVVLR